MPRTPRPHALRRLRPPAVLALLVATVLACGPRIEEDPPIPEHRLTTCETWCSMMFDPVCPAQDVEVPTEDECVEGCSTNEVLWGTVDGADECAATNVASVDCVAALACDERRQHFERVPNYEDLPPAEWSSCGELTWAQLECQLAHQ